MNRADKRRRKLKAHRKAATGTASGRPGRDDEAAPTEERLRRGDIRLETLVAAVEEAAPRRDWTGQDPGAFPGRVTLSRVRRDVAASVRRRLGKLRHLTDAQLSAAERLEKDWRLARLEPRMTADLSSAGVASGWRGPEAASAGALDARERVQAVRRALRKGGPDVLRAVEAAVIDEETADRIGADIYAGRRDASVHARTLLWVGLNLLADHYAHPQTAGSPG